MNKEQKQQLNKKFTKKFLIKLYWDDKLSHRDIIRKYNITYGYIYNRFKKLDIPLRTSKESIGIAMIKFKESRKKYLKSDVGKKAKKEYQKYYNYTPPNIYNHIKTRADKKELKICSQDEFIDWYNKQKKQCVYCNILEKSLSPLNWGWKGKCDRLTIDRKDNSKGYTLDNIQLACYVCNFTKSDVFNHTEMKKIGKVIKEVWQKRIE